MFVKIEFVDKSGIKVRWYE